VPQLAPTTIRLHVYVEGVRNFLLKLPFASHLVGLVQLCTDFLGSMFFHVWSLISIGARGWRARTHIRAKGYPQLAI
jgi:hypothetical protein